MPRIRTIKPDFYRDKLMQQMEREHPELKPMLVYSGLWTASDKEGRFEWDADTLHLDILPFINFDMNATLELLKANKRIEKYSVDGKEYGHCGKFKKHQRITGKEYDAPARYPAPGLFPDERPGSGHRETPGEQPGNDQETPGCPGKGREKEREEEKERERIVSPPPPAEYQARVKQVFKKAGYKFDDRTLNYIAFDLVMEFPEIDHVEECKKKIAHWVNNPLGPKSKVCLQLRNWFRIAREILEERQKNDRVGGRASLTAKEREIELEIARQLKIEVPKWWAAAQPELDKAIAKLEAEGPKGKAEYDKTYSRIERGVEKQIWELREKVKAEMGGK